MMFNDDPHAAQAVGRMIVGVPLLLVSIVCLLAWVIR